MYGIFAMYTVSRKGNIYPNTRTIVDIDVDGSVVQVGIGNFLGVFSDHMLHFQDDKLSVHLVPVFWDGRVYVDNS